MGHGAKAKGDFSFEISPPDFPDFRRPGSAPRSQLIVIPETFGAFEQSPRLPYSSVIPFVARAFLSSCRNNQFPECFASFVSDSPGVPLPVPLMALVCSLLLENFSSVDLKDTRDLREIHLVCELFFCGNSADFVENAVRFGIHKRKYIQVRRCRFCAGEKCEKRDRGDLLPNRQLRLRPDRSAGVRGLNLGCWRWRRRERRSSRCV